MVFTVQLFNDVLLCSLAGDIDVWPDEDGALLRAQGLAWHSST